MTASAVSPGSTAAPRGGRSARSRLPRHVAIIMDGNRRWASARGVSEAEGHAAGVEAIRPVVQHAARRGIEVLTIYAFSRENWRRSSDEVRTLIGLLEAAIRDETPRLIEEGVRVRLAGRLGELPDETRDSIEQAIQATAGGTRMTLTVAFNYSSRAEIVDAVRAYQADGGDLAELDEAALSRAPLHGRPARARPAHPHRRRPAHQQLPALAGGLRGALLLHLGSGPTSGPPTWTPPSPSSPAAPAASAARREVPPMRERAISAVVIAVVVIAVFLAGQPWLTLGVAALALLASLEVFRLLPPAGFPVDLLPGVAFAPLAVLATGWLDRAWAWVPLFVALAPHHPGHRRLPPARRA